MIEYLLTTPESHADAYTWLAVLLAHAFIGVTLVAVLGALVKWHGMIDRPSLYGLQLALIGYAGWEMWHWWLSGDWRDSLVDWTAVACGAIIAYAAWERKGGALAIALTILTYISARGRRGG